MIVTVHMLAFGKPGEIREVDIPEDEDVTLDAVFRFGQNDFQPQQHPSVSVGDVIELGGKHLVCPLGFRQMTEEEFQCLTEMPQHERIMRAFDLENK